MMTPIYAWLMPFAAVPDPWTLVYWGIVGMDPTNAVTSPVLRAWGSSGSVW